MPVAQGFAMFIEDFPGSGKAVMEIGHNQHSDNAGRSIES